MSDRVGVSAAGPETAAAGYKYIYRLARFWRTGTGCLEEDILCFHNFPESS